MERDRFETGSPAEMMPMPAVQPMRAPRRGAPARLLAGLVSIAIASVASPIGADDTATEAFVAPGADAGIAEIEACASRNLPDAAGEIGFAIEAVDRTGAVTASRAVMRWRKDEDELAQLVLRISEPAQTAGTALLIVDRASGEPEFYVRLPELERLRRVRSRRLRGPVLGTDFSYEDLNRLRGPLDRTRLELIGIGEVEGRPAWLLETRPDPEDGSEYSRVLTWVDQEHCLPVRVDLFEPGDRLRKQLHAPFETIRRVGDAHLPHRFVMEDRRRETRTVIRIERFVSREDLPAAQFTRRALQQGVPAAVGH